MRAAVVRVDGDADARGGMELEPLIENRVLEDSAAALDHLEGAGPRVRIAQQNDELVASETRDRHMTAFALNKTHQAACHRLQHRIPGRVAEGIVNALETVQIHVHHGNRFAAVGSLGEQPFGGLDAALPIGQPGEWIKIGQPLHALGGRGIAQNISETTRKLSPVDRLADEIGRPRIEGANDGGRIILLGEKHQRNQRQVRLAAKSAADRVAVHPSGGLVEQHQGHIGRLGGGEGLHTVVVDVRLEAQGSGRLGEQAPMERVRIGNDCTTLPAHRRAHAVVHRRGREISIEAPRGLTGRGLSFVAI